MKKRAVIAGASGLIGGELMNILLEGQAFDEVLVVVRKKLLINHEKLSQLVIHFDQMEDYEKSISGDVFFCCLGSTQKKTPDKTLYYKIDHDYPLCLARLAVKNGCGQFHLISAISANVSASGFYSRMKGETARDISQLDIRALYIYEPSLITGDRKENRAGERFAAALMKVVNPFFFGSWKKYRSILAADVARVMVEQSVQAEPGKWLIQFALPELIKKPIEPSLSG
jgi:uncharacterized protein YbjT (DUF2867 family)